MNALENRLAAAKARLSQAAADCLAGKPFAAEDADEAQAEVNAILALLKAQAVESERR
jgi:hypothetical protein